MKSLQDITTRIGDGLHGTPKYDDSGDYYFINGNNLSQDKITLKKETRRVSKEEYLKYKKDLNDRTLLVSINGTLGNFAFYNNEKVMLGKSACYLNLIDDVDKEYIGYLLKNRHFQKYIDSNATGTTIKNVSLQTIRSYEFELPPKKNQQDVSNFLSSLDQKIKLNKKMNENLEEIAKTLFKSWFIDFDPVRAKAEGKPSGLSKEISDLFPDSFEDSELGEIPRGWKIELFQDVVDEYVDNRGKTPPLVDIGIPLVEVKHMHDNSQFPDLNTDKYVSKDIFDSWFRKHVEKYDVLISTVGTIGLTTCVFNSNFAIAQNVLGLRFSTKSMSLYMFNLIKSNYFQHQMNSRLVETVQKSIKRKDLNEIPTLVPSEKILIEFFNFASANLEKQFNNKLQNATLSNLRDMLLPKLISGQLTIPEADNIIKKESV